MGKRIRTKPKIGNIPGSLVYTGNFKDEVIKQQLIQFSVESFEEQNPLPLSSKLSKEFRLDHVNWYNLHGLHDIKHVDSLGKDMEVHPLVMEDILDTAERPKIEESPDYIFVSTKSFPSFKIHNPNPEQISFVLKKNVLLSLQEHNADIFEPVRERLRTAAGMIRSRGADYMLFRLMYSVFEQYQSALLQTETAIDELQNQLNRNPPEDYLQKAEELKTAISIIKKVAIPNRENVIIIEKSTHPLITEENRKYFDELVDKLNIILDECDSQSRDIESLTNIYYASLSQKMNEVMKMLTIISTIFIPLSFIAGVYGMNFHVMPELENPNGYYYVLGAMGLVIVLLLFYFKKRNWL